MIEVDSNCLIGCQVDAVVIPGSILTSCSLHAVASSRQTQANLSLQTRNHGSYSPVHNCVVGVAVLTCGGAGWGIWGVWYLRQWEVSVSVAETGEQGADPTEVPLWYLCRQNRPDNYSDLFSDAKLYK